MSKIPTYAKAIAGAVAAGAAGVATALADGHITAPEWGGIVAAVLVPLGVIWAVPNAPADTTDNSPL